MIYFLALIPATGLTIAGYFVLFLSNRSEGAFRAFGKYLGFWAFTLAGLVLLGAIFAAAHGGHHHCMGEGWMHGRSDAPPYFPGPREERPATPQAPTTRPSPAPPSEAPSSPR
ncbi:MAG TPA: hypothetical protein VKT22_09660 [Steroidobacteraceae bacterium]|nr:hypothetical protein [Steroidobacteraceae bacterium]